MKDDAAMGDGTSFDANAHRDASLESWQAAASGWARRQELMRDFGAPVSHWMVDALNLQSGQRVLELAAGLGETGFLAAELVAPMGGVIVSDQAEEMLEGARARLGELSLNNVEFQVLNAEWIDLPVASVDAVLCRWGYMLMADPPAALRETRRVLRPGGRVAFAVWGPLDDNPWAMLPEEELRERKLTKPATPGTPGPFSFGTSELVAGLLDEGGFTEIRVQTLELTRRHTSFQELWDSTLDLSPSVHNAVLDRPQAEIAEIAASLAERFAPYTAPDGSLAIPGRTFVASAGA
ncbi:MAG TPA: methyltransferase domain-containing protein [Solirubrobacteraceae bacterium]|jgi:SAM-dependent methyltransferase